MPTKPPPDPASPAGNANLPIGPSSPGNADLPIGTSSANQEIGVPTVPKGWHSRGYLPHFDGPTIQHVTLHLADSLPKEALERITQELEALPEPERDAEKRKRVDAWIDAGHGWCILREPEVARMVQGALHHFAAERYHLFAWVIMPNHLHVLFQPLNAWPLAKIVASWKKFTARGINDWRTTQERQSPDWPSSSLPIWHPEYGPLHARRTPLPANRPLHPSNPVKAGLTPQAKAWPWSSAFTGNPGTANLPIGNLPPNQEISDPTQQP